MILTETFIAFTWCLAIASAVTTLRCYAIYIQHDRLAEKKGWCQMPEDKGGLLFLASLTVTMLFEGMSVAAGVDEQSRSDILRALTVASTGLWLNIAIWAFAEYGIARARKRQTSDDLCSCGGRRVAA